MYQSVQICPLDRPVFVYVAISSLEERAPYLSRPALADCKALVVHVVTPVIADTVLLGIADILGTREAFREHIGFGGVVDVLAVLPVAFLVGSGTSVVDQGVEWDGEDAKSEVDIGVLAITEFRRYRH